MNPSLLRRVIGWTAALAVPALLPCCAPAGPSVAHGENVSTYFTSAVRCPENIPAWTPLPDLDSSAKPRNTNPYHCSRVLENVLR